MGLFDLVKNTVTGVTNKIGKNYKQASACLGDIEDEEVRLKIIQLSLCFSAVDGIETNEINTIIDSFSELWKLKKNDTSLMILQGSSANTTEHEKIYTSELFNEIIHYLSEHLNSKQKQNLTQYLIDIIQADGIVSSGERYLLVMYKRNIGLHDGFWGGLSKLGNLFKSTCPACKEPTTRFVDKKELRHWTQTERRQTGTVERNHTVSPVFENFIVTYFEYELHYKCDTCEFTWTKLKQEKKG